jgi:hypothetical protein
MRKNVQAKVMSPQKGNTGLKWSHFARLVTGRMALVFRLLTKSRAPSKPRKVETRSPDGTTTSKRNHRRRTPSSVKPSRHHGK